MTDDGKYLGLISMVHIIEYTDNAGWTAAQNVFGSVIKHLLCRWHIDKYVHARIHVCIDMYVQNYMYIHVLFLCTLLYNRNWRQHLRSIKDSSHQVELYHTLNVLLEEPDTDTFKNQMGAFIKLWETTVPDFIKYFNTYYASRAG